VVAVFWFGPVCQCFGFASVLVLPVFWFGPVCQGRGRLGLQLSGLGLQPSVPSLLGQICSLLVVALYTARLVRLCLFLIGLLDSAYGTVEFVGPVKVVSGPLGSGVRSEPNM